VTVSFTTRANLSRYGAYNLVAFAYNNNDDYLFNDTLRINLENNQVNDSISVYPNPFTDNLTLYLQSSIDDILNVSLINNSGSKLYETEKSISTGMNTIIFSDLRLSTGIYYLKIKGLTIDRTIPVVKVRK